MRRLLPGLFAAVLALLPPGAFAQEVVDPCTVAGACRPVGAVSVPIGGGRMMAVPIGQTVPWVADGTLVLFPGEAVIVSLAEEPAEAPSLTLVLTGEAAHARNLTPGEMRFTFAASETGMMLKVESGHKRGVRYAAMMVPPRGQPRETRVCPVPPGMSVYESWPNPIVQLALSGFTPLKKGDVICR